ncbi:MAG: TIM barrel protein [Planctomycetota bacterium]
MPATIACSASSYGPFGAQAAIRHLRQIGLQYLELPILTQGQPTLYGEEPLITSTATEKDVQRVSQFIQDHGVRLSACQIDTGNPLFKSARQIIQKKMDIAAQLDVKLVIGNGGELESSSQRGRLIEALRELGDYAQKLGQTYCLDMQPGVCSSHRGMLELMRELQHPHIWLNFDTGALFYYNEEPVLEIALQKVAPYLRHLNLSDSIGEFDYWYFPALGYGGAVDFLRVHQIISDSGVPIPLSIHVDGIEGEHDLPLAVYQQRVADSVMTLRECGYFTR